MTWRDAQGRAGDGSAASRGLAPSSVHPPQLSSRAAHATVAMGLSQVFGPLLMIQQHRRQLRQSLLPSPAAASIAHPCSSRRVPAGARACPAATTPLQFHMPAAAARQLDRASLPPPPAPHLKRVLCPRVLALVGVDHERYLAVLPSHFVDVGVEAQVKLHSVPEGAEDEWAGSSDSTVRQSPTARVAASHAAAAAAAKAWANKPS